MGTHSMSPGSLHMFQRLLSISHILPMSTYAPPYTCIYYSYVCLWYLSISTILTPSISMQVRIQDLVKGGPQLLRPKVGDIAKWSRASEASILRPGSRARLRALEAFGFLMLKYAFSHILETLFLLFLTSILTPKVDKNRALDFTSINLRHSDMLHLFFNLHEKVML